MEPPVWTPTRISDEMVKDGVAVGFRRAMGRIATPAELETLRPLWEVAGYQEGDMFWGAVFVFAKQVAAVEDSVWKSSELIRSASDVLHDAAEQLAASTKVAGEQAREEFRSTVREIVRQYSWLRFTSGLVLGAGVILAGAVYVFEPVKGVMDHLADAIGPELVERMALGPDAIRVGRPLKKIGHLRLLLRSCNYSITDRGGGGCSDMAQVEWGPIPPAATEVEDD